MMCNYIHEVHLLHATFVLSQRAEKESRAGRTSRKMGTSLLGVGSQP